MIGDAGEIAHRAGSRFAAAGDIAQACGYVELGRALLLDGGGDGCGQFVDALDDGGELVDRVRRFAATVLDAADQTGDVLGRLRGLVGQFFDLGGDNGEAAAGLARTGGFDRGVESQ